jgi:hypothetical protein
VWEGADMRACMCLHAHGLQKTSHTPTHLFRWRVSSKRSLRKRGDGVSPFCQTRLVVGVRSLQTEAHAHPREGWG